MRVTKPTWVRHDDEKGKKFPIYSLSVHPDGTRLATGSIDKKVKIWSTLPILDAEAEKDEANHRLLCTMSSHTGSVLTVRWAHHGRFLASGSDDTVVMLWGLDPDGGGRVFGSDEVNVENWKALKRLVGHTADIIDIAWSKDDSMLASVGLDKVVNIWDGYTFERTRRLDLHTDFVKGVTWDPAGKYLATQSDDKTVKVWEVDSWTCVKSVEEPFEGSPKSTFFRRLSWSPDGAFIAASNAMNGPVFVAAVIERDDWKADISFVGHENTIQIAAFNPHLFFQPGAPRDRLNASCMVALGADDFSISIWRNTLHVPLVVLKDIFARALLDLCWSNDGFNLYGCSEDGSICAISFDPAELPELEPHEATDRVLGELGYQPKRIKQPQPLPQQMNGFGSHAPSSAKVNVLQPRKAKPGERKRIGLNGQSGLQRPGRAPLDPMGGMGSDPFNAPLLPAGIGAGQAATRGMFEDAQSAFDIGFGYGESSRVGQKRPGAFVESDRGPKGRTMASTGPKLEVAQRDLRAVRYTPASASGSGSSRTLPVPRIQTSLRVPLRDATNHEVMLEITNAPDAQGRNRVAYVEKAEDQWVDFVPCAVIGACLTDRFSAVGLEDGMVIIYSPAGRHLWKSRLEAPISQIAGNGRWCLVVLADCSLRVIDSRTGRAAINASLAHLLSPGTDIVEVDVRPNGAPHIQLSSAEAYAYSAAFSSWIPLCTEWQLQSIATVSRSRQAGPSGPLADIESRCQAAHHSSAKNGTTEPEWFDVAQELELLEHRLRAAEVLDSREEWKYWAVRLARVLGEQGFRARADEWVRDLVGPLYAHPSIPGYGQRHAPGEDWSPTVCGLPKREVAKAVLGAMGSTQALAEFAQQWQVTLMNIAAEEADY